ncbi:hypothetical protein [Halocatena pleomorpha]|uniref:Uncharacterized protein n=1 Tax=Halocatena pleomorpha TaxID=1785090 RepID=A0A3P3RJN9_9EURY|nr:hypothetical protein [Halocatena pleomorpha]RRJ33747.1 hypothetical protein EIK79_02850 [Halocatena pleomorpha]
MDTSILNRILQHRYVNAVLAWSLIGFVGGVAVVNASRNPLWAGFATVIVVLSVIPAVRRRSMWTMLPWEVLVLASLPLLARTFGIPGTGRVATYLSVATVALIIAVELDAFTAVSMTDTFAVLFVVITTMAASGVWAVVRWSGDVYLGIVFPLTERELMIEFIASTIAGVIAGVVFDVYFRRLRQTDSSRVSDA